MDQAGHLIWDVHLQARPYLVGDLDIEEPMAGGLWEKVSPKLERAFAIYDKQEAPATPAST